MVRDSRCQPSHCADCQRAAWDFVPGRKGAQGDEGFEDAKFARPHERTELICTALAELSTRQIAESVEATGMNENESAAKTGGGIAKKARLEWEGKTGKKVVSAENYLLPAGKKIGEKKSN